MNLTYRRSCSFTVYYYWENATHTNRMARGPGPRPDIIGARVKTRIGAEEPIASRGAGDPPGIFAPAILAIHWKGFAPVRTYTSNDNASISQRMQYVATGTAKRVWLRCFILRGRYQTYHAVLVAHILLLSVE